MKRRTYPGVLPLYVRYTQREWVLLQIIVTASVVGVKSRAIDSNPGSIDGLLDGLMVRGWRSVGLCEP